MHVFIDFPQALWIELIMEREALCVHILGAIPEIFGMFWAGFRGGLGNKGEIRPCSLTAAFVGKL